MSDSRVDAKRERLRRKNKRRGRKSRLRGLVAVLAVAVVAAAALVIVIHNSNRTPDKVTGLTADTCYSQVTLSWDKAEHADSYVIYRNDGSEVVKAGETEGADSTSWTYEDYDHNTDVTFTVAGCNSKAHDREGEQSDPVTATYDSSKYAQKIPILGYHKVVTDEEEVSEAGMKTGLIIKESVLESQLKYLKDNGYTTLTLDEFYEWHAGKKEFPPKSVVMTFDDGYYGVYYVAYPLFKKYDMAGAVFCIGKNTAGEIAEYTPEKDEKDQYIKEDAIHKVREEYPKFALESHTFDMHNRVKGKKPALSFTYDQIMEDCRKNEPFGFTYLAYPWGTYSENMQNVLKDAGYKMAFAYNPYFYAYRSDDTFAVNRIKISGLTSMDEFIDIVSGDDPQYNNPDAPEEAEKAQ